MKRDRFSTYIKGFWLLLFPDKCKKCSDDLYGEEEILCRKCCGTLPRTNFEKWKENPVAQSFWGRVWINHAFSIFYFRKGETLQKLIHQLKYKKNRNVGIFLGRLSGNIIKEAKIEPPVDYLVPVPLHPKKLKIRGYNQCDILAQGISETSHIPIMNNVLIRNVYNVSQTRKGRFERWENVEGIFTITQPNQFEGKHVLIIDDIITTGSTLEACCAALSKVNNIRISIMTIGYSAL